MAKFLALDRSSTSAQEQRRNVTEGRQYRCHWSCGSSLPGYVCVVCKRHVIEPFELPESELIAFWQEAMLAARTVNELYRPLKMNYEIHGNTIPHPRLVWASVRKCPPRA